MVENTAQSIEKEKQLEKYKDELIANVSHDLKTPLTSVIGYLSLIEEGRYSSEEELLAHSHTAYLKTKQLESLVEDLFEYTKLRQPSMKYELQEVNLTAMLDQFSIDFVPRAEENGITFESKTTPEILWMRIDTEKLVRVFNNLIDNALKYGKGATKIQLLAEDVGSNIVIIVRNDGEKIPTELSERLFERFFRVEDSRTLVKGGSGLGLAIVHMIVKGHGGSIQVISNSDWTSFVMNFPKGEVIS
jgi:signal transduction histidine kinase